MGYKKVFSYLLWANPKFFANSQEQRFYDNNTTLFNASLNKFNESNSLFGLIKADIILDALANKNILDEAVKTYSEEELKSEVLLHTLFDGMHYLTYNGVKIYLPIYDVDINLRYQNELYSLKTFPYDAFVRDKQYSLIDTFDRYGFAPFDSTFTRLVKLRAHDEDSQAFYHPELDTILVIDDQGNQQAEITIFDDRLKRKNQDDLFTRIETAMKFYFDTDMSGFLQSLFTQELISDQLYDELKKIQNSK